MKKAALLLLIGLTSAISGVQAQIGLGVKGGLNIAGCAGAGCDEEDTESLTRVGFHAGLVASFIVNQRIELQTEVLYSQLGSRYEDFSLTLDLADLGTEDVYFEEVAIKNNYIVIPILFKVYLVEGVYFNLGPQLSYLLQSTTVFESSELPQPLIETDTKAELNNFDFGIASGIGYDFRYGLTTELRYSYGFTNIIGSGSSAEDISRNTAIQVSIGYRIIKNRN
ncbi:MAG: porin family protein [Cyclobacteriaceae bacterium]